MPTNSTWFQVVNAAETPDIGWQVRVLLLYDYAPAVTKVLAYIDEFVDLTVSQELNGEGSASVTFDADSPQFSIPIEGGPWGQILTSPGYHLWEIYQDGALRFQFFVTSVQETILDEEGTRGVTVSGPGSAHILTWAKVMPPGYPAMLPDQEWPWTYTTPAMQVWSHLLRDAQVLRRVAPQVVRTFTSFTDSAGKPWTDVTYPYMRQEVPSPDLGTDLLQQLRLATGQETEGTYSPLLCDWIMWPNWRLDVRPTIGVDRSDKIIFFEGQVQTVQRQRSREEVANIIVVRDDHGQWSIARNNGSIGQYGRRELLQQHGAVNDKSLRDALAANLVQQLSCEKSQWTVRVPPNIETQKPWVHFNCGDWIGISRNPWPGWTGENTVEKYRVLAISVRVSSDGEELELSLESLLEHRQRKLQRRFDMLKASSTEPKSPVPTPETFPDLFASPVTATTTPKYAVWNPRMRRWEAREYPSGLGGGNKVWIQPTDPGSDAAEGDFWYDTSAV